MLIAVLLVAINLRSPISAIGPLIGSVQASEELSSIFASLLIGLPVLCFALFAPLAPVLARTIGIERGVLAGLVTLGAGILLRSFPAVGFLWLGTAVIGFALAILNVLITAMVKEQFPTRTSRVTGYFTAAQYSAAAATSALMIPLAGIDPEGWRVAFALTAVTTAIAVAFIAPIALRAPKIPTQASDEESLTSAGPTFWVKIALTGYSGLQAMIYYAVMTWWPTIEESNGQVLSVAGLNQGVLQVVAIFSSLAAGWLLQRNLRSFRGAVFIFGMPGLVGFAGQALFPDFGSLWVALLGISVGGTFVVATSLFSVITQSALATAKLAAFVLTWGYLLAAAGPVLVAAAASRFDSWSAGTFLLVILQALLLVFGTLAVRPVRCQLAASNSI